MGRPPRSDAPASGAAVVNVFSRKTRKLASEPGDPPGTAPPARSPADDAAAPEYGVNASRWSALFKTPWSWNQARSALETLSPAHSSRAMKRPPARGSWVGRTLRYGSARVSVKPGGPRGSMPSAHQLEGHGVTGVPLSRRMRVSLPVKMDTENVAPSRGKPLGHEADSPGWEFEEEPGEDYEEAEEEAGMLSPQSQAQRSAKARPAGRKRKAAAAERDVQFEAHMSAMREYFKDVDSEVLVEESPPKDAAQFRNSPYTVGKELKGTTPAAFASPQPPVFGAELGDPPSTQAASSSPPCRMPGTSAPASRRPAPPVGHHTAPMGSVPVRAGADKAHASAMMPPPTTGSHPGSQHPQQWRRRSVLVPAHALGAAQLDAHSCPKTAAAAAARGGPRTGAGCGQVLSFTPFSAAVQPAAAAAVQPGGEQAAHPLDAGGSPGDGASPAAGGAELPAEPSPLVQESPAGAPPQASPAAGSAASPLQQLIGFCQQAEDSLPDMDALLASFGDVSLGLTKVGEGMLGEAYRCGGSVFKIMPIEGEMLVNGASQKQADEVLAEVKIAHTLSALRDPAATAGGAEREHATMGFVQFYGAGVCRGRYSSVLQAEWHRWDKEHGSENDPVDCFDDSQLFIVLSFAEGGVDLEHFELESAREAISVLHQVTLTLAVAEKACQFEHRDLHWGNILLRRSDQASASCTYNSNALSLDTSGVEVVLIDFTLSRLITSDGELAFCDLESDPELFQGPKADCQAETYRRMRKVCRRQWAGAYPATNALWLHYLADLLLGPKKHQLLASAEDLRALRGFRKRALAASSAADLVNDELFHGRVHSP
eukprot:jgi/Tetstr1/460420/TSEL_005681.t1